jgi:hypothetical protein
LPTENHDVGRDEVFDLDEFDLRCREVEEAREVRLEAQVGIRDTLRTMNEEIVEPLDRLVAEGVKLFVAEKSDWVAQAPIAVFFIEARDHVDKLSLEGPIVCDEVDGLGLVLVPKLIDHLGRLTVGATAHLLDGDGYVERVIGLLSRAGWAEEMTKAAPTEGSRKLIDELGENSECEHSCDPVVVDEEVNAVESILEHIPGFNGSGRALLGQESEVGTEKKIGKPVSQSEGSRHFRTAGDDERVDLVWSSSVGDGGDEHDRGHGGGLMEGVHRFERVQGEPVDVPRDDDR